MFAGFNIIVKKKDQFYEYYDCGLNIYNEHKKAINNNLQNYINIDGSLSQELIEGKWFPKIDAHVFLSHSHSDIKFVISFAGWLYKNFEIKSFIDYSVWGNADDLLRSIDEKYCVLSRNDDGSTESYSYKLRNKSTSNVYMILYTALMKMIDNTECLMFINTPASIKWSDMFSKKAATTSPWIYGEILASKLIEIKSLQKHRGFIQNYKTNYIEESVEAPSFEYNIDSKHLWDITDSDLQYFEDNLYGDDPYDALNGFYMHKGIDLDRGIN